jgi:hypothetical protein
MRPKRTLSVAFVLGALAVGTGAAADARCMYGGRFYGPGATDEEDQPGVVQPSVDAD